MKAACSFLRWLAICSLLAIVSGQSAPFFDGTKAFEYLTKQCDFGPRVPGTEAHRQTAEWMISVLSPLADETLTLPSTVTHPMHGTDVDLTNILARFNPQNENRLMFLAHWDTREIADQDPNPDNRDKPIPGANDGASGVAVLLTLAGILHDYPVEIGVDLLFVDGEDMGVPGKAGTFALGTKSIAKKLPWPRPRYAVLLDMVGDANAHFPMEVYSVIQAYPVVKKIWNIAEDLGYTQFRKERGIAIEDDHRVLYLETGIPAIDIIDFNYPDEKTNYWHTLEDTPDKCSAETLEAVGNVITTLIYRENQP